MSDTKPTALQRIEQHKQSLRPQEPQRSPAALEVERARALAEVEGAMILARKFPRDEAAAMERILSACDRDGLAEGALYRYARGGQDISGPSIRLAEAIAQAWGNLQFGLRELSQADGESTIEAFAWDLETNVRQTKTFVVPHVRESKRGRQHLTDPRDVYETVANQGARRLRACILGVIPGDIVQGAVDRCEATNLEREKADPRAVEKLTAAFAELGVTTAQIETRIQRKLSAITPEHIVALRGIYQSLRDGMSQPAQWFGEGTDAPREPGAEG